MIWPPWHSTTNNIANFDPRFFDQAQRGDHQPVDRSDRQRVALQRHRAAGRRVRRAMATISRWRRTRRCWRSSAASRAVSPKRTTTCSSRALGMSYSFNREDDRCAPAPASFHNRVTLNDSTILGGQPPFQPMVTVANGSADNPSGGSGNAGADLPFGSTAQDPVFKHPTVVHVVGRRAARSPVGLHRRRDLRRPPRPLPAARAQHQSARGGHGSERTLASTSPRCGPTRATARSGSRRTPAPRSTTACSSPPIAAT